jgi:hypothetical protein
MLLEYQLCGVFSSDFYVGPESPEVRESLSNCSYRGDFRPTWIMITNPQFIYFHCASTFPINAGINTVSSESHALCCRRSAMYIDIWSSLIPGVIIIVNTVNSMLHIYYTTKCISNTKNPVRVNPNYHRGTETKNIHDDARFGYRGSL